MTLKGIDGTQIVKQLLRRSVGALAAATAVFSGTSHAVNIAGDGIGEVAIAPYYTVRNGWLTTINLTNTTDKVILVKVRMREADNSRDIQDFVVAMPPYDVFSGLLQERPLDGKAVFVVRDQPDRNGRRTCTVPSNLLARSDAGKFSENFGSLLRAESYGGQTFQTGPQVDVAREEDGGSLELDRLKEGYIEFFVLGHAAAPSIENYNYGAVAEDKTAPEAVVAKDCAYLDMAFSRRNVGPNANGYGTEAPAGIPAMITTLPTEDFTHFGTASEFGEPINALKFNVRLLNPARGLEAGYEALTLANFYNPVHPDELPGPPGDLVDAVLGTDGNITETANRFCSINIGDQREGDLADGGGPRDWYPGGGPLVDDSSVDPDNVITNSRVHCRNFVAEQSAFAFLEPSLNNAYPEVAMLINDTPVVRDDVPAGSGTPGSVVETLLFAPAFTSMAEPQDPSLSAGAFALGNVRGIDAVTALLMRRFAFNEWASRPSAIISELSDWVVTFPTKNFYVDSTGPNGYGSQQAIGPGLLDRQGEYADALVTAPIRPEFEYEDFRVDLSGGVAPTTATMITPRPESILQIAPGEFELVAETDVGAEFGLRRGYAPFADRFDGQSCVVAGGALYDRAENQASLSNDDVQVSPAPPQSQFRVNFCKEANVLTFNGQSVLRSANNGDFAGNGDVDVSTQSGNANFSPLAGWLSLDLDPRTNDDSPGETKFGEGVMRLCPATSIINPAPLPAAASAPHYDIHGMPVLGFVIKQRTFAGSNGRNNYASAISHSFLRDIREVPASGP